MNYAVLEIPDFPLHARLRLEPAGARPVAIYTGGGRKARLAHLNAAAAEAGLRPDMSGVQGLGLCPELLLWSAHAVAEQEATALLLSAAWGLSPRVEVTGPGLCTAALGGRDPAGLRRDTGAARQALAAQGLPARIGVGTTPGVARFAAYHAAPELWVEDSLAFLAPLPVGLLELTETEATLFESLGLHTLGALARLPQASLSQRLGERGARLWAQAAGRDRRPLQTATPPARHHASYDLEHPAETLEPLLFLLRRFVERLATEVGQASLVAASVRLALRLEDETRHERDFRLPQPTARADSLFKVLEQYLGALHLPSAVTGLELELTPAAAGALQEGLFESALRDPHQFFDTLARVAAVLGEGRVGTPVRQASHRPDAVGLGPPPAVIPDYRPPPGPPETGPLLRRFRPPHPATVELGDDAPAYVLCPSARTQGEVRATRGPWRRDGEWWDRAAWAQEEWDVELSPGGLYRLIHTPAGWFLEGAYD